MTKSKKEINEQDLLKYLTKPQKIESNIIPLDKLLAGGFSPGTITQIVGETKTGKTTLALQISNNICIQGKKVLYIDAKGDITREWLEFMRLAKQVNNNFYYVKESNFNDVEDILDKFIGSKEIDLIIIDSLPSLINERYTDINSSKKIKIDNNNTNYNTRPLMLLIKKLKKLSIQHNISLLFINEFRNKIDVRIGTIQKVFGPKELEYESNDIIQIKKMSKSGVNKEFKSTFEALEKENIGIADELKALKSSSIKTITEQPLFFEHGSGYHLKYSVIYNSIKDGTVKKSGSYYTFKNITENGICNFINSLEKNGIIK